MHFFYFSKDKYSVIPIVKVRLSPWNPRSKEENYMIRDKDEYQKQNAPNLI